MANQTIVIIRHAEKPVFGGDSGIDATGMPDSNSLTPRGWQRAGAWSELFAPSLGQQSVLPKPNAIFASAPTGRMEIATGNGGSKSRRPLETISSLASKLKIQVNLDFTKGDGSALAKAISTIGGVVLVCWQHEEIVAIANAISPTAGNLPESWPDDRFNVVFKFDRTDSRSPWGFEQIVPVILDGDGPSPI